MRATITRSALQAALAQAVAVVPSRTTLPILHHVLIEADTSLTLSATDLDRAVMVSVPATVEESGRIAVPARTLSELVKTLSGKPVRMERDGDRLVVRQGRTVARLPIADADDFPALPTVDMAGAVEIGADTLADLIGRTAFAASTEQSRPILNGALIESRESRLRVVATNGHRLAAAYGPAAPEGWPEVIVPSHGMDLIARALKGEDRAMVAVGENYMAVGTGRATVYTRLIEGPYPNYEGVIPKEHTTEATVGRAALLAAVSRAMVVASDQTGRIRMEWDADGVQVSATTPDTGEMTEVVECQVEGPAITIGFNGAYLTEILSRIATDEAVVRMSAPERAAVILPTEGDVLYLCMPLRLLD